MLIPVRYRGFFSGIILLFAGAERVQNLYLLEKVVGGHQFQSFSCGEDESTSDNGTLGKALGGSKRALSRI